MRCYNLGMLTNQISTTSYIKSLIKDDYKVGLDSADGQKKIAKLLNKTVLKGGKRLRPILTVLFGRLAGVEEHDLQVLARSIEFVHAASLAHDDVIDNATMRRGKPSINVAGDNKMSILAGDFLLAEVISDLSCLGNSEVVTEMASIIKRLSLGEWLQHECLINKSYSEEIFSQISNNKTSSVLEWCSVSPFVMVRSNKEIINLARNIGSNLGICFQLYDDLLDFSTDSQKDQFLDIENGQLTYLSYLYLKQHNLLHEYTGGTKLSSLVDAGKLNSVAPLVKAEADRHHAVCLDLLEELLSKLNVSADDKNLHAIKYLFNKLKNRTK